MAAGNVTVSLPQMIDLALNVPEHGSVNFNLLQSILHVIVQQLELAQCKIEFRGNDGEKVQNLMSVIKPETTVKITEYVISPAKDAGKVVNRKGPQQEGAINIDQVGSQEKLETVVLVEPGASSGDSYMPCVVSRKQLEEMNAEVAALKEKVRELAELPGNTALIEALRGAGIEKGTPVLDMFQMMTLAKKVEANEGGLEKMASMIEDLAKQGSVEESGIPGANTVSEALSQIQERLQSIEGFLDSGGEFKARPAGSGGRKDTPTTGSGASGGHPSGTAGTKGEGVEAGAKAGADDLSAIVPEIDTDVPDMSKMNHEEFANTVREELLKIKEEIQLIYSRLGMLFHLSEEFSPEEILSAIKAVVKKHVATTAGTAVDTTDLPAGERLERLEDQYNGTNEQLASLDSTFNQEINNIHTQFAEMEKAFGTIMEKIHFGMPGGDSAVAGETLGELYDKLMGLQSDMENLAETAGKLVEDKEDKQRLLEVLTEQVEFLKTVKADKEDLEDALADKADACAINRKVSHDQFDTACDELSRGIEDALAKLTQQEELWQQALDEIQKEIGNKLDRMELGPLRDFVNNKLKMLQQRLKALTALKKETEAAGTKKFLRNVNCISCDKDVVMRKEMDPSLLPQPYSLPPSRSMGPYLAYELDALRKQQKSLPNSRNLNHFESALHQKSPRTGEDHICNRYCGGSHTITTPQQRVTRLGHFLNQWGPEAQPVSEGGARMPLDDKLTVVGTSNLITPVPESTLSPKVSKIESGEKRESMKEGRRSTVPTGDRKLSVAQERRASKGSGQTSITSPKTSGAEVTEKRRSSVGSGQRISSARRLSQTQGSTASVHKEEKSPQLSTSKIPEETASEVEKANEEAGAPSSPGASPEGDAPPADSGSASAVQRSSQIEARSSQVEAKTSQLEAKTSQMGSPTAKASGQISNKTSRRGSKSSAVQMSARQSAAGSPQKSQSTAEQGEAAPASPPAEAPAEQPAEEPPAEAPPAEE